MNSKLLQKTIDLEILKLKLSPQNPLMTFPEQEAYVKNHISYLYNKMNDTNSSEVAYNASIYIEVWSLYWKLIQGNFEMYKESKNDRFKKEYLIKVHELHSYIQSDISNFKRLYNTSKNEVKLQLGLLLVQLYSLYIDITPHYYQYSSGVHISIYTEVLNELEALKKNLAKDTDSN